VSKHTEELGKQQTDTSISEVIVDQLELMLCERRPDDNSVDVGANVGF
jgi:hypothetical protein